MNHVLVLVKKKKKKKRDRFFDALFPTTETQIQQQQRAKKEKMTKTTDITYVLCVHKKRHVIYKCSLISFSILSNFPNCDAILYLYYLWVASFDIFHEENAWNFAYI